MFDLTTLAKLNAAQEAREQKLTNNILERELSIFPSSPDQPQLPCPSCFSRP